MTSAKTKATYTLYKLLTLLNVEDLTEDNMEFLTGFLKSQFLEHERDTRYAAIDIINSMEKYSIFTEREVLVDAVDSDEAISFIHNLTV